MRRFGFRGNAVGDAVFFGNGNRLVRGGDLTGVADSKLGTISVWARLTSSLPGTCGIIAGLRAPTVLGFRLAVAFSGSDVIFQVVSPNAVNTQILNLRSTQNVFPQPGWVHFLASWDMSNASRRHIYVNDASDLNAVVFTNDTVDYTHADWRVGGQRDADETWPGDLAYLWFKPGVYLDFSVEANRRKFITSVGKPAALGDDGSLPTGSVPLVYLTGDVSNWHLNKGTGGGFSVVGALTPAATSPSA